MPRNPYIGLPREKFWRTGVAGVAGSAPPGIYTPKFRITKTQRIATAGSCFAQHVGRHLRANGFAVVDVEPPPRNLPDNKRTNYGYAMYSARYGNLYTARQLLQLTREAFGQFAPIDAVWRKGEAFVDAMRPAVEPEGLTSEVEVRAHRAYHLARVRQMILEMDVFVFTLGLTECWEHRESGTVYPTVPGSVAGEFDAEIHGFRNLGFNDVYIDLMEFRRLVSGVREGRPVQYLLTVSPVPLAATASDQHVLPATILSKSILRAVAGELHASLPDIDYYPSFEIITNPWSKDDFYEANRRDVSNAGVTLAMKTFLAKHSDEAETEPPHAAAAAAADLADEPQDDTRVACEEAILSEFAERD